MIQIGGVYTAFCQEDGILLQKHHDRNGRCIAILSRVSGSMVNVTLLTIIKIFGITTTAFMGHTPSTADTFRKKFQKDSGKTPETLSERFLEFLSRVRLGSPKPYETRYLKLPEHFQNYLPPSTAGGASFFRSGCGEGLSELVMEFPAVLRVFKLLFIAITVPLFAKQRQIPGCLENE